MKPLQAAYTWMCSTKKRVLLPTTPLFVASFNATNCHTFFDVSVNIFWLLYCGGTLVCGIIILKIWYWNLFVHSFSFYRLSNAIEWIRLLSLWLFSFSFFLVWLREKLDYKIQCENSLWRHVMLQCYLALSGSFLFIQICVNVFFCFIIMYLVSNSKRFCFVSIFIFPLLDIFLLNLVCCLLLAKHKKQILFQFKVDYMTVLC